MTNENQNQEVKTLYASLVKVIGKMQTLKNSEENPFTSSAYLPLSDILEHVRPILDEHGLAILLNPSTRIEEVEKIDGQGTVTKQEKIFVKIQPVIIHESGENLELEPLEMPVVVGHKMNESQAVGSAISYGRRYILTSVLGIASKDNDANTGNVPNTNNQEQNQAPQSQSQKETKPPEPITVNVVMTQIEEGTGSDGKTPIMKVRAYQADDENQQKGLFIAKENKVLEQLRSINVGDGVHAELVFNQVKSESGDTFNMIVGVNVKQQS